jgi:hypothetical protein
MRPIKPTHTLGAFETVGFPEFGLDKITAKIDTGAYTGSLHCTKIEEKQNDDGSVVLEFSPFDHPEITVKEENFVVKHVKSSNGDGQSRYFIETIIEVNGEKYPIALSLADRSEMKWPVLIGRRFLRKHSFIVDVSGRKALW